MEKLKSWIVDPPPLKPSANIPSGNATVGEKLFKARCAQCHPIQKNGKNSMHGPNLYGVYGRLAGSSPGYTYSPYTYNLGVNWDDTYLYLFLENPKKYVYGTKCGFSGFPKEKDRSSVVEYLKKMKDDNN